MGQEFNLEHENANLEILKSCSTQEFSPLKILKYCPHFNLEILSEFQP